MPQQPQACWRLGCSWRKGQARRWRLMQRSHWMQQQQAWWQTHRRPWPLTLWRCGVLPSFCAGPAGWSRTPCLHATPALPPARWVQPLTFAVCDLSPPYLASSPLAGVCAPCTAADRPPGGDLLLPGSGHKLHWHHPQPVRCGVVAVTGYPAALLLAAMPAIVPAVQVSVRHTDCPAHPAPPTLLCVQRRCGQRCRRCCRRCRSS